MSEHESLFEALLAVQQQAPKLRKNETAKIPLKSGKEFSYKYIGLDTVMEIVLPILSEHGLVWMTFPCRDEAGDPALRYQLAHAKSKESVEGTMPLLLAQRDPQAQGSGITYARRYSLMAVLGLVADEDDDAAKATHRRPAPPVQQQAQRNGSEYATKADQDALAAAAKGLTVRQIKLALGSVGSSFPEKGDLFSMVPKGTAKRLTELLASTPREQPVPAAPGELS